MGFSINKRCYLVFSFTILGLMCRVVPGTSQNSQSDCGGIYRSYTDYVQNKISIRAQCPKNRRSIVFNRAFSNSSLLIRCENKKIKIDKDSIFAVTDCNGNSYRMVNRQLYKILDTTGIWIYEKLYPSTAFTRKTSRGNRLETKTVKANYFSTSGSAAVESLTLVHIQLELLTDKNKVQLLLNKFKTDDSLANKTDDGKYSINEFLKNRKIHEEPWGQQTIRFFDPDHHLIEVGESMSQFVTRFYQQGLTFEQVAACTGVPVEEVRRLVGEKE